MRAGYTKAGPGADENQFNGSIPIIHPSLTASLPIVEIPSMSSNLRPASSRAAIEDCTKPDRVVVGVRRPEVAADALQEAFVQVWRNARSFSAERGDASAWLTGIVRYRALDAVRKLRR